ncbi:hypothetical protein BN135_4325 [Cronobacter muytjensii 530]
MQIMYPLTKRPHSCSYTIELYKPEPITIIIHKVATHNE